MDRSCCWPPSARRARPRRPGRGAARPVALGTPIRAMPSFGPRMKLGEPWAGAQRLVAAAGFRRASAPGRCRPAARTRAPAARSRRPPARPAWHRWGTHPLVQEVGEPLGTARPIYAGVAGQEGQQPGREDRPDLGRAEPMAVRRRPGAGGCAGATAAAARSAGPRTARPCPCRPLDRWPSRRACWASSQRRCTAVSSAAPMAMGLALVVMPIRWVREVVQVISSGGIGHRYRSIVPALLLRRTNMVRPTAISRMASPPCQNRIRSSRSRPGCRPVTTWPSSAWSDAAESCSRGGAARRAGGLGLPASRRPPPCPSRRAGRVHGADRAVRDDGTHRA